MDTEKRIAGASERRLQVQAARPGEFTKAKRVIFLDHLAATCNAMLSARAAGVNDSTPYALRRRDPVFAEQWSAALAAGAEHLEAKLLAHALAQADPATSGGDPSAIAAGPFDPAEARALLAQLRATMNGARGPGGTRVRAVKHATIEEVRKAVQARMVTLRKRLAREQR